MRKALTGPKLTRSKSQILRKASDGYGMEPMPLQLLVPAAASPDGAAAAWLCCFHGEPRPIRHGEFRRRRWVLTAAPLIFLAAASLCRAVTGVPAAPCWDWWSWVDFKIKRSWAISVCGFAQDNSRRRLSKIFDRLRPGRAQEDLKCEACACKLRFRKQMVLSDRIYPDWHTRPRGGGFEKWLDDWNQLGRAQDLQCNFQDGSFYWRSEDSKAKGMKWLAKNRGRNFEK